jgi:hypothetical protein
MQTELYGGRPPMWQLILTNECASAPTTLHHVVIIVYTMTM